MRTGFKSGKWYRYIGDKYSNYADEGEMDFMKDGKFHKCNKGERRCASFYDSTDPNWKWVWIDLKNFIEMSDVKNMNWKEYFEK